MEEPDRPQSPFAGMADFSARTPLRVLLSDEIERMLAEHRRSLETEYPEGHRANFSSADLTGRDFSGLNLRGIKMDRAVLRGADFTGAHLQSANLVGAMAEQACFDRADLSRARLSGPNLVSASFEDVGLANAEMEFAQMANAVLQGACLGEADMSGAQLDAANLTRADLRNANLRGADFVTRGSTRPTSAMHGSVAHSWSGRRCGGPTCAVRICACSAIQIGIGQIRTVQLCARSARSGPPEQRNKAPRRLKRGGRCQTMSTS